MAPIKAIIHQANLLTLPTENRSHPPSLTLHTAHYDTLTLAYVPVDNDSAILTLPLDVSEHVAALRNVGCRRTGLMRTFLVVESRARLTIGRLDIANSTYEVTGRIDSVSNSVSDGVCDGVGDGGGGDGGGGDGDEECLECWLVDGPTVVAWYRSKVVVAWEQQDERQEEQRSGAHVDFEELGFPELGFLGLGFPTWKAEMVQGEFQRVFVAGDRVLCVSTGKSSGSVSVRKADIQSFLLPCTNRYTPTLTRAELPLELDPLLITCVLYPRSSFNLLYEVVFGTSDGQLKCCSHNNVIMEVTLEDSPVSVTIAESVHGVPVLVVSLGGMDRKVVTLFADSLHQINSWTGIQQVIVEELARVGQDQILLLTQPSTSSAISFAHCQRVSLLQPGSQNPNENHKSNILKSINEALEIRLQDGVQELQAAEQRRLDKMQMLTSACNLMQTIATGAKDVPLMYMQSVQLQEIYMGRCFLILDVHLKKHPLEGFDLRHSTLFATSLRGFVKSMASCLPSQGNSQRFLFSFPLKDCTFPLHIILAGGDKNIENFGVEGSKLYTQWIHSIEDLNLPNQEPGSGRSPAAVCEKWMKKGAVLNDHLHALVRAALLQTSPGNYNWSTLKEEKVMEEHTKAPLSAMYVQDLALVSKTTNSLDILSKLYGPRLVEMVIGFADVLVKEIQSHANGEGSGLSLTELQAATDRCFCHLLASITHNSFGYI